MTSKRVEAVPVYGNYHGYYSKRPFSEDQRLALLPIDIFRDARVLDVGCNEGWVTCQIAQTLGAHKVVGVDIDDSLIRAAWKRRRAVWSMQAPEATAADAGDLKRAVKKRKIELEPQTPPPQTDYFPSSCEHMFGPLPIPPHVSGSSKFPHNVVFYTADWVNTEIGEDSDGYDVIIAFSISKWIHLNGGDDGLMRFFRRVHSTLKPGGAFVLEAQPWDTYSKAKRMDPKLRATANELKLRPDGFAEILRQLGFGGVEHRGTTGEGGFHRPIDVYRKLT